MVNAIKAAILAKYGNRAAYMEPRGLSTLHFAPHIKRLARYKAEISTYVKDNGEDWENAPPNIRRAAKAVHKLESDVGEITGEAFKLYVACPTSTAICNLCDIEPGSELCDKHVSHCLDTGGYFKKIICQT